MAKIIVPKKSSTAGKVPLTTDLVQGELAINLADRKIYSKNAAGAVIEFGGGGAGGGTDAFFGAVAGAASDVWFETAPPAGGAVVPGPIAASDVLVPTAAMAGGMAAHAPRGGVWLPSNNGVKTWNASPMGPFIITVDGTAYTVTLGADVTAFLGFAHSAVTDPFAGTSDGPGQLFALADTGAAQAEMDILTAALVGVTFTGVSGISLAPRSLTYDVPVVVPAAGPGTLLAIHDQATGNRFPLGGGGAGGGSDTFFSATDPAAAGNAVDLWVETKPGAVAGGVPISSLYIANADIPAGVAKDSLIGGVFWMPTGSNAGVASGFPGEFGGLDITVGGVTYNVESDGVTAARAHNAVAWGGSLPADPFAGSPAGPGLMLTVKTGARAGLDKFFADEAATTIDGVENYVAKGPGFFGSPAQVTLTVKAGAPVVFALHDQTNHVVYPLPGAPVGNPVIQDPAAGISQKITIAHPADIGLSIEPAVGQTSKVFTTGKGINVFGDHTVSLAQNGRVGTGILWGAADSMMDVQIGGTFQAHHAHFDFRNVPDAGFGISGVWDDTQVFEPFRFAPANAFYGCALEYDPVLSGLIFKLDNQTHVFAPGTLMAQSAGHTRMSGGSINVRNTGNARTPMIHLFAELDLTPAAPTPVPGSYLLSIVARNRKLSADWEVFSVSPSGKVVIKPFPSNPASTAVSLKMPIASADFEIATPAMLPRALANNYMNCTDQGLSSVFRVDGVGGVWSKGLALTSDARLKENVTTLSGGVDLIKQLRPVSFDWIDDGQASIGFIAQEVETVIPTAVATADVGPNFPDLWDKDTKYSEGMEVLHGLSTYKAMPDAELGDIPDGVFDVIAETGSWKLTRTYTQDVIDNGIETKSIHTMHIISTLTLAVQEITARLEALEHGNPHA
jgi:hypothetical protein